MADLPSIKDNGVTIQGPRSRVTADDVAGPYQQAAQVLNDAAKPFKEKALDEAEIEGQGAVYRDTAGQLQVKFKGDALQTSRVYDRVARQSFLARLSGDIRRKGTEISVAAKGNPDTFSAAWRGFQGQLVAQSPRDLRPAVTAMADDEGAKFALGVSEVKREHDLRIGEQNLKSEAIALDDEASALALKGGTGTPAYRERMERIEAIYGELTANPEFGIGARAAEIEMKRMQSRHIGFSLIGEIDNKFAAGGLPAARKLSDSIMTDENLLLTRAERRELQGMARGRIENLLAIRKAELEPVKAEAEKIIGRLNLGDGVNNPDVDDTLRKLASGGDLAGVIKLTNARASARFFGMSDADQVAALERMKAGKTPGATRNLPVITGKQAGRRYAPDMSGVQPVLLDKFKALQNVWGESVPVVSGYRDPDRNKKAGGAKHSKHLSGDALDLDVSGWSNEKRVNFIRTASAQGFGGIGVYKNSIHLDAGTRRAWGPTYGRGSVPDWAKEAIGEHLAGSAKGAPNTAQAAIEQPDHSGADLQMLKDWQDEVTADTKNLFDDIKSGLLRSRAPSAEDLDVLNRQLAVINDPVLKQEAARFLQSEAAASSIDLMPPEESASVISTLNAEAADGASIAQQEMLTALQRHQDAKTEALSKNPIGYAVTKGLTPNPLPIDFAQPDELGRAFFERQKAVDALEARGLVTNAPATLPEDGAKMVKLWSTGDPKTIRNLTETMAATLSPKTLARTLSSGDVRNAVKGAAFALAPEKHVEAMRALDLIDSSLGIFEVERSFGKETADRLQDWQSRVRYFSDKETAEWLKQRNDPNWASVIKPIVEKGHKEARAIGFDDIAEGLGVGRFIGADAPIDGATKRMMVADFETVFADRYAVSQDADTAKEQALKRMQRYWGKSESNSGRLMYLPPEAHFPPVGGSLDWIGQDLQETAETQGFKLENASLVADKKTETAVLKGEAPGYLISVFDPETGTEDMLQDDQGRALRWSPDPAAAKARTGQRSGEDRQQYRPVSREQSLDYFLNPPDLKGAPQ